MRKVLIEAKNLSIGDTVASMPYIFKFQDVNPNDKIFVLIKKELVPYFKTIYNNVEYIDENLIQSLRSTNEEWSDIKKRMLTL